MRPAPSIRADEPIAWFLRTALATAAALDCDVARGLTGADADRRLARHGPNVVAVARQRSLPTIVVHQFRSLIVGLLVSAGIVSLVLGQVAEAVAIGVVIVLNALIGIGTEWKAADSLARLQRKTVFSARARRDGVERQLSAEELVPGDIVLLAAGDRVPADGRVVSQSQLQVDEAMLTGESAPVSKSALPITDAGAPLADQSCMLHMATVVTAGRAEVIVTATGARTELGRIGSLIAKLGSRTTPLEAKLRQLGRMLLVVVAVLCAATVVAGVLRGNPLLSMLEVGISLAIAAVPEGLLAVTTMTLAVGMQRMAKMDALVRRLPAVESLGSATVICTDKTGTLTKNEMTVRAYDVAGRRFSVTGTGYAATGELQCDGERLHALAEPLALALRIGALCNDARLDRTSPAVTVLGDPTEAALIVAAEKAGLDVVGLGRDHPRIMEVPFDSTTKLMATVHRLADGRIVAYVKGAPSALLAASCALLVETGIVAMTDDARELRRAANDELAASALRVLGLAVRDLPVDYTREDVTRDLTFVGLVGMIDPLRDEALTTVATCRRAGIRVIMITGDQQATATEIARQLGIDRDPAGKPLRVVHARELAGLDDDGWIEIVRDAAVFARVSPEHKLHIVEALQRAGQVVAMTGDGVNDAPALRKADIGIAMGARGTEVAKDAADMVITDDNFATIVRAIEQGRVIVYNILRFIHFLFSTNLAEIVVVFGAIMLGWPLPLGVLQILWLNLVTDVFPAMALALEPSAPDVMDRKPRDPHEALVTPGLAWHIVWQGLVIGCCTLVAFAVGMRWYGAHGAGLRHAITLAFMTLAIAQVFHTFNARSRTRSIFTARLLSNGWLWAAVGLCLVLQLATVTLGPLRALLGTEPLAVRDAALIAGCSLAPIAVVELVKFILRARRARPYRSARADDGSESSAARV